MRTAYEVQVMLLQEVRHAVWAKCVGHAAVILAPALDVLVWVRPQQVAQEAAVWHICGPRHALDLLQRLELGGQAAMHAQDLHSSRWRSILITSASMERPLE